MDSLFPMIPPTTLPVGVRPEMVSKDWGCVVSFQEDVTVDKRPGSSNERTSVYVLDGVTLSADCVASPT